METTCERPKTLEKCGFDNMERGKFFFCLFVCLFVLFFGWFVFLGYGVSLSFYSALFTLNTYC